MAEDPIFDWIPPMKTGNAELHDLSTPGWAAEMKWDGIRATLATDGERVVMRSSSGRDITTKFPELAGLGSTIGAPAILDGELVVFQDGRPAFSKILSRLNSELLNNESDPAHFVAFDLLALDQHRLLDLPYHVRRSLLADLELSDPAIVISPYYEDGAQDLLEVARERQLEGVVIKRLDSRYQSGARSLDWRKLKIRLRQEFVVGGWLPGQGSLGDDIGSLVLGVWDGPELVMVGSAGSGLSHEDRQRLADDFTPRASEPFHRLFPLDKAPNWVEPLLVIEAEFSEWTAEGRLRHPVYVGTRYDLNAQSVTREPIHG